MNRTTAISAVVMALALACSDDGGSGGGTSGSSTSGSTATPSSVETTAVSPAGTSSSDSGSTAAPDSTGSGSTAGVDDTSGSSESGGIIPGCGNGVVEDAEACDLGSLNGTGLGCKDDCTTNFCQDGYLGPGEQCDDDNDIETDDCLTTCAAAQCGDGFLFVGVEVCDGTPPVDVSCESLGLGIGPISCLADCTGPDTSECHVCGDGVQDSGEDCDGLEFDPQTDSCAEFLLGPGPLTCELDCTVNTSQCSLCGNNVIDPPEICDGTDLVGETCVTRGFFGGNLACTPACDSFVTTGCF